MWSMLRALFGLGKSLLSFLARSGPGARITSFSAMRLKTASREITHGETDLVLAYSWPAVRYRVDTFASKEPETLVWIDSFPEGASFVDVGANIGLYSVYAGARGARVLAIEPGPENIFTLIRNVQLNNLSHQINLCFSPIGHRDGELVLIQQSTMEPGGARLTALHRQDDAVISWQSSIRTLDSLCAEQDFWPDFLKVDIDGNEIELVRGAEKVIRRAKQILLETDIEGPEFRNLLALLEALGHKCVRRASADPGSTVYNLVFVNQA